MSSGNISVGFIDGRAHSRVLKPPGGGYSDLFFDEPNKNDPPKRAPPARSECMIESILRSENELCHHKQTTVKKTQAEKVDVTDLKIEEVKEENGGVDDGAKKKSEPASPQPVEAPRKVRVPPGGFSSGLW